MSCHRHGERGASLGETAIAMTVILVLLVGIIDFGRAIYAYGFVGTVAREGARWAIVRGSRCTVADHCNASSSDISNYVLSLNEGATPSNMKVTTTWPTCAVSGVPGAVGNGPGCVVSVNVTYTFAFLLPWMGAASIPMSSTSQMVISE